VTDQTLALTPASPLAEPAAAQGVARDERRGLFNRRLKDRRGAESRINARAPRLSNLKVAACWATSATVSLFVVTLVIGEVFYGRTLYGPLSVIGGLVALSAIAVMLGMIEERLIEIRLELMMLNGGGRRSDQASGAWDGGDRRSGDRRQRTGGVEDRRA